MNNYRKDEFVGTILYGFCNGFFGGSSYGTKVIIASGKNWIVAKEMYSDIPEFASFEKHDDMEALINEWSVEDDD